jgi:hypothetical protein
MIHKRILFSISICTWFVGVLKSLFYEDNYEHFVRTVQHVGLHLHKTTH